MDGDDGDRTVLIYDSELFWIKKIQKKWARDSAIFGKGECGWAIWCTGSLEIGWVRSSQEQITTTKKTVCINTTSIQKDIYHIRTCGELDFHYTASVRRFRIDCPAHMLCNA